MFSFPFPEESMGRTPRIALADARHHVMNRTAGRRAVFTTDADLERFTSLLAQLPGRFGARVHAWALMSNHFHLLLETPRGNLSDAMAWLAGSWARATNAARGTDGPLFRGRFKNRVVLDDAWWRHLLFYVHLNPVEGGAATDPDDTRWTSHRAYVGLDPVPPWLTTDELTDLAGGVEGYRATLADLRAGRIQLPPEVVHLDELPASTAPVRQHRVPAAVGTQTPEAATSQVLAVTGCTADVLAHGSTGRLGNPARALWAWWLVRSAALPRRRVAERLGCSPGAVGSAVHQVAHAPADEALGRWRDQLWSRWQDGRLSTD